MSQLATADARLYGMMRYLMALYGRQQAPEDSAPRGVVGRQDALDAVIQLAAVVDEAVQDGRLAADRGMHAAAMLMILREYVQPLPVGLDANGYVLAADLGMMVTALRKAREASGHRG